MCITFLAVNKHKKFKFILLFNRDEFFNRPTSSMGFHYPHEEEYKDFLMFPLDHISGGTFLCVNVKNGNFCVLLNHSFKEFPYNPNTNLKRGAIALEFCKLENDYDYFFKELIQTKSEYNGYNIICGNMITGNIFYFTNNTTCDNENFDMIQFPIKLDTDIIGLSNNFIHDSNSLYCKKVEYGKKKIQEIIENSEETSEEVFIQSLFSVMEDDTKLIEEEVDINKFLDEADVLKNSELKNYLVSSVFVKDSIEDKYYNYGTRHTIILTLDYENNMKIYEHCDEVLEYSEQSEGSNNKYYTLKKRDFFSAKIHEFQIKY